MLDVRLCIETRKRYSLKKITDDELLAEINKREIQKELFFVVPEGFLYTLHNKQREEFEARYNIVGIFDMGQLYTNTGVSMVLVQAVSQSIESVKVAIFNGVTYDKRKNKASKDYGFVTPTEYIDHFNRYIKELESWINEGITPDHDPGGRYEYNFIPMEEVDNKKLYPKYYSRRALEIRKLFSKEKTVLLSDVADILIPREQRNSEEEVKRLRNRDVSYPLDIGALQFGKPTSIILQKGDIVFPRTGEAMPYLFYEDIKEKIYASPHTVVIKSRKILPEYLYFYLTSDTAVHILESISTGAAIRHINKNDLEVLPIVLPSQDKQKYRADFEIFSSGNIRKYGEIEESQYKKLHRYYSKLNRIIEKKEQADGIEDVLNVEMVSKIRVYHEKQLRTFLADDLRELNACFTGKAYKATLILAGSILEAVLIDWLSEIHHKNYFEQDYMVTDRRTGRSKRAELIDYINAIKKIERPKWMEEASKAHEIRQKRNLVHAKLCLKFDDINEEMCKQVIDYLKDVLKTRGVQ